jgi:hypothetical protein
MALTYTPEPQKESLPLFATTTVDGRKWSSESVFAAPAKVLVFICNHCPYVKAIEDRLIVLARELRERDVPFVGICSNDPRENPEDEPSALLARWREKQYGFDYLVDPDQQIAKKMGAVCTPDFFVYDKSNQLVYRGRLDDSWKNESLVQRRELKEAVLAVLVNKPIESQSPSMGCSIKWK